MTNKQTKMKERNKIERVFANKQKQVKLVVASFFFNDHSSSMPKRFSIYSSIHFIQYQLTFS